LFINAENSSETSWYADVAIVGAGAAGIALADALDSAGLRVCLVESGGQQISTAGQSLNDAGAEGLRTFSANASRFRCFGGSTSRWGGQCRPLDANDFQPGGQQSDSCWPFDFTEMLPYYRRAAVICNLPANFDDIQWRTVGGDHGLDTISYAFSHPRDFGENYRVRFQQSKDLRVLLNATVTRIQLSPAGNAVSYLSARTSSGDEIRVEANSVVIAGGGIENARLLLASNDVIKAGIGNENDLVGRYFNDHPYAFIGELRPFSSGSIVNDYTIQDYDDVGINQKMHRALTLDEATLARENLNGCALYFVRRPGYKATADYYSTGGISLNYIIDLIRRRESLDRSLVPEIIEIIKGADSILATAGRGVQHLFSPSFTFAARVVLTSEPNADSRVTLGKKCDRFGVPLPMINWQLHESDKRGLRRLLGLAKEYFADNGIGEFVEIPWDEKTGWPRGMTGGKHHMGTTRMHANPSLGVVTADSRVHGVDNLYIAGSSVFPTGGYANPTLTIIALALRLADHLKES
jgi:choline dehydrogenase-like flavoprotein